MAHDLDIWHTFEKQGGKALHTIRTRDAKAAKAMMVAPQLLEALQLLVTARSDVDFDADMIRLCYEKAEEVIKQAKGE